MLIVCTQVLVTYKENNMNVGTRQNSAVAQCSIMKGGENQAFPSSFALISLMQV